jgi:hypothetical protein
MPFQKGHKPAPRKKSLASPAAANTPTETPATVEAAPVAAPVARFAEKKKRIPVGLRDPMAISGDLDPNFNYRFVRNSRGRVDKFLEGGYEMVTGDARIGDANIAKASNMGSAFSIPSGDNEDRAYLMRIPKVMYDEDQAAKQAKVDAIEQQLHQRPKNAGLEGEIKLNR